LVSFFAELLRLELIRLEIEKLCAPFNGAVDVICGGRVRGWAWNADAPDTRLTIIVRSGDNVLAEVEASRLRQDLADGGLGDGRYAFEASISPDIDVHSIEVTIKEPCYELPIQPGAYDPAWLNADDLPDTQVTVYNLERLRAEPPARHFYVRLDTNFDCNLHCVYCHNPRSKDLMEMAPLKQFLEQDVLSVENFQIGCTMEPTLDKRLTDFMLMIAETPARPNDIFQLQTNGTLLHMHDFAKMKDAGLTSLSVSLDSAEPKTQKQLRSGTSLKKVLRNVEGFRKACPDIGVQFITTVTSANIDSLANIVRMGLEIGVSVFAFREMFYDLESKIVDHTQMPGLLLESGSFAAAKARLMADFPDVSMEFMDTDALFGAERKIRTDSLL
jgi:sulfatase maturation enzyme AslB (radical SAM superfamily)